VNRGVDLASFIADTDLQLLKALLDQIWIMQGRYIQNRMNNSEIPQRASVNLLVRPGRQESVSNQRPEG